MAPNFTLVVPLYNEQENVAPLVAAVEQALGAPPEAVLVDDGSTDATWERLAQQAADRPWMRLLRFEANAGQSAAFFAGIQAASHEIIVTMDADLQNDPADIPRLLEKLDEADMVCGWRTSRRDSFSRRAASAVANRLRRCFTRDGVPDTGCSLKAFRRRTVPPWAYFRGLHRFLPAVAVMQGFRVVSLPVAHHPRRAGRTKYTNLSRLWAGLADLVGIWWLRRRRIAYAIKERVR
jgi:glycosyltransferase involved in cell wall biosynthesis